MNILTSFKRLFERTAPPKAARPVIARSYAAADTGRLFSSWEAGNNTGDEEIKGGVRLARARSRELARNNDYAKAFLRLLANNVVGPDGFKLQVKSFDALKDGTEKLDERANRSIELAWANWSRNKRFVHSGRRHNWVGFSRLAVQSVARDGEVFVVMYQDRDKSNPFRFSLGLLEADYLDENHNEQLRNGNIVVMGLEVNADGAPVAYHFFKKHPGATNGYGSYGEKTRVPAEDVLHLFRPDRPTSTRGMPWFDSSIPSLKMLSGYEEAELIAARVSASKMGFYTSPDGDAAPSEANDMTDEGDFIQDAVPGKFGVLPAGYGFTAFDPTHPSDAFSDFCKYQLRKVGAGLGVSYTSLGNNLEGTSYSSIRQGALDERDGWMVLQNWLIEDLCVPVFERWLESALITQAVKLPLAKFDKFNAPVFKGRRWTWVDPAKDAAANQTELNSSQATLSDLLAEKGVDYEEHLKQLGKEIKDFEGLGLLHPSAAKQQGGTNGQKDQKQNADQAVQPGA